MQTLILSCNTGAGHNSCAQAVQEAYHSRGEICNIIDSLQFISEKASTFISNWHTRIYRHAPRLFDAGYQRAESHEDIFVRERRPISYFPPAQSGCINTSALQATIILSVLMYSQPWR